MSADAYLPVVLERIPAECFFEDSGRPRPHVEHHLRSGVLRLIAGPTQCHAIVDIRRPYSRPPRLLADAEIASCSREGGR